MKINKSINIEIITVPKGIDPTANQKNVSIVWDEHNILTILSTVYDHVMITEIKTEDDLKQLALRKPDLVFSGVKYFDFDDNGRGIVIFHEPSEYAGFTRLAEVPVGDCRTVFEFKDNDGALSYFVAAAA